MIGDDNKYKRAWDIYVMFCVGFVAVYLPYKLAFNTGDKAWEKITGAFIDFSFFVDMVLTFFTVDYDEKYYRTITNHKEIAMNYIKGWFFLDLFSILPLDSVFASMGSKVNQNIGKGVGSKFN